MSDLMLDERLEMAIALSVSLGDPGGMLFRAQEEEARRLSFRGAEIDAARQGRSFDIRTSQALAVAAAAATGDEARR